MYRVLNNQGVVEITIHVGLGKPTVSTWSESLTTWVTVDTDRRSVADLLWNLRPESASN